MRATGALLRQCFRPPASPCRSSPRGRARSVGPLMLAMFRRCVSKEPPASVLTLTCCTAYVWIMQSAPSGPAVAPVAGPPAGHTPPLGFPLLAEASRQRATKNAGSKPVTNDVTSAKQATYTEKRPLPTKPSYKWPSQRSAAKACSPTPHLPRPYGWQERVKGPFATKPARSHSRY